MADKSSAVPATAAEEVEAYRSAQETDWGTYVAVQPISYNGVPAYNVGDPVPASNVKAHKYEEQGLVAKATTKAAQDVVRALHRATQATTPTVSQPVSLGVPVKD